MANGILTKGVSISYWNPSATPSAAYVPLAGLTEFPSLNGTKEKVDVTTLEHGHRHYIPGIEDYSDLTFKFIYDKDVYATMAGFGNDVKDWCVEFPDGAGTTADPNTKFYFKGIADPAIDGAGVNAALTMSLSIFLQSDIGDQPTHA